MRRVDAALYGGGSIVSVSPETKAAILRLAGWTGAETQLAASITRDEAIKVPSLSNGLQIILGLAQGMTLTTDQPDPVSDANRFLARLDPDMPPGWTVARAVDSIVWYSEAWLAITDRYATGFPAAVRWLDNYRVTVDTGTGRVRVDGDEVDPKSLIRVPGILDPLLARGAEAVATALANTRAARRYAQNPKAQTVLTDIPGEPPLEADDAQPYIDAYTDSARTGKPVYLAGFQVNEVGWTARELQLIEARQADAIEMARLLNLDPVEVGAPQGGTSLSYQNNQDRIRGRIEAASAFLLPIEQRLSMPDVTPLGARVTFDADAFIARATPPTPQAVTP